MMAKELDLSLKSYPYLNPLTGLLKFSSMKEIFNKLSAGSIVIIQPFGHNPTGTLPSREQWEELLPIFKKRNLLVFFDCAYHGFTEGIDEEKWIFEQCLSFKIPMLIAYSFSKNFGIYGERAGVLHAICENNQQLSNISSQLE